MAGREDAAQFYLTKHRINDLFHNITASIVFDRPGLYLSQHNVLFRHTRLQLTALFYCNLLGPGLAALMMM